jgi:hypothetical protein
MTDKEREDFYDSLPIEEQVKINIHRKNFAELAKHIDEVSGIISAQMSILDEVQQETDRSKAMITLFMRAEDMDMLSKDHFIHDICKEYALECDWVRHSLDERGLNAMFMAVEVVNDAVRGEFDSAQELARAIKVRQDEADAIIRYWKESQEG